MLLAPVNLWAVLVSGLAFFLLGWIWYGPLFGKSWMQMMNLTKGDMKSMKIKPAVAMLLGLVSHLLIAFVLAQFLVLFSASSILSAMKLTFWLWLGFVATMTLGSSLWEGKSFGLWAFNNAFNLIGFLVMTIILSVW